MEHIIEQLILVLKSSSIEDKGNYIGMRNVPYKDYICGRGLSGDECARIVEFHKKFIEDKFMHSDQATVAFYYKLLYNEIHESLKSDDGCNCIGVIGNTNSGMVDTWRRYFKRRPGHLQPTPTSWGYFIHFSYEDITRFKLMVSSLGSFNLVIPTNNAILEKLLFDS